MIRTRWKGALLTAVASAGVAWGQPVLLSAGGVPPAERIVTLQQKDGLPEPCRVLKTWTTAEGRPAYLLQSLDTDEMLTVVQKVAAKGDAGQQVGASIYRWSNRNVPPEGSPVPPPDGAVRRASYTTEAPPPRRPGDLPRLTPVSVMADASCAPPAPVVAHAPTCASGGCDKGHCSSVHHYEKPTSIYFLPGDCVPVCAPEHAPNYGYYPTRWHAFPAGGEAPPEPAGGPERVPAPKSATVVDLP